MKKLFKYLLVLSITSIILLTSCTQNSNTGNAPDWDNIPVRYSHASWGFNVYDPELVVGDSDYVFIGYVEGYVETTARNETMVETHYMVNNVRNIKGNLMLGSLPVSREGGVRTLDGETFLQLFEGESLPEIGHYYVFLVRVTEDGDLHAPAPTSTIRLDGFDSSARNAEEELEEHEVFQLYVEAYENERFWWEEEEEGMVQPPERHTTPYDVNYTGE